MLRSIASLAVGVALAAAPAWGQTAKPVPDEALRPDPSSVKFTPPADIPWTGEPGRMQQYLIAGDPAKPGPYAMLLKWWPNQFSRPHFHNKTRYFTVVSGVWWMSSSPVYDPAKTYPLPAGTVVVHEAGKVHWDGAKDEAAVLMLTGEGPVVTTGLEPWSTN